MYVFISLGTYLGEELLGQLVILCLFFILNARFPKQLYHSHWQWMKIPISPHLWWHFLLFVFDILNYTIHSGHEVVSYWFWFSLSYWIILWTKEPGGLWSTELQKSDTTEHMCVNTHTYIHTATNEVRHLVMCLGSLCIFFGEMTILCLFFNQAIYLYITEL